MGIFPPLWSYKNTSFHCRDWWGFYGGIVIVVLSINSDLGRPHRLTLGRPHPFYRWRFQAITWAPPLPLISYSLGMEIRILSDNLHVLQAQREPWLCRLVGQVQQLLPDVGLSLGKDLMWHPKLVPLLAKRWSPKKTESSRTKHLHWPISPTRWSQLLWKAFCPCFETRLLGFNQTWSSQDSCCPSAVRKGEEWK